MSFEKFISSFSQKYLDESIENIIYTDEEAKIILPKTSLTFIASSSSNPPSSPSIHFKVQNYYFTSTSMSISGMMTLQTKDMYGPTMKDLSLDTQSLSSIEVYQPELELYKTIVNFIPHASSISMVYPSHYKIQSGCITYDLDLSDAKYIHYVDAASEIKCLESKTKIYYQGVDQNGYTFDLQNHHQFIFQNIHLTKQKSTLSHIFFDYIQSPHQVKCIYEDSCPYLQCPLCTGKKRIKVLPDTLTDKESIYLGKQMDHEEKNTIKYMKEGKDKVMYVKIENPQNTIYGKYVWYDNQWIKINFN